MNWRDSESREITFDPSNYSDYEHPQSPDLSLRGTFRDSGHDAYLPPSMRLKVVLGETRSVLLRSVRSNWRKMSTLLVPRTYSKFWIQKD